MLTKKLIELEDKIKKGQLHIPDNAPLWGGADVIIADAVTKLFEDMPNESRLVVDHNGVGLLSDKVVRTKQAKELSAVFDELKYIFNDFIDAHNKYIFYGNLAQAAIDSCKLGDGLNVLLDTVREAKKLASEIEEKWNYYFAYGSNMDVRQMMERCPGAEIADKVILNGYKFIINERGVATLVQDDSSKVYGILWIISKENERSLDRYEGVRQNCYFKVDLDVDSITNCNRSYSALTYLAYNSNEGEPRDGYIEKVSVAAKSHEFDEAYVNELRSWIR